jgi:hypothetical protein
VFSLGQTLFPSLPQLLLEMITSTDLTPRPSKPHTRFALTRGSLPGAAGTHLRPRGSFPPKPT